MARLSSFRRFHGNRESFGCTKVEPRNEKNQVVSLFRGRARARSLFATSRRPSGRRPLDLTIVKMKHKSYALLIRVCLTLSRFSFLLLAASTFRPVVLFSTFDQHSLESEQNTKESSVVNESYTLNVSSRQSYLQRAGLIRETK